MSRVVADGISDPALAPGTAAALLELLTGPEWQQAAACRGAGKDMFFSDDPTLIQRADRICARCPVRGDCALRGVEQEFGRWAGHTVNGLRRMQTRNTPEWRQLISVRYQKGSQVA